MKNNDMSIASFLNTTLNFTEKLPFKTVIKNFAKDTKIITQGDVEKNLNFLVSGIVETAIIKKDGQERITEFFYPNNFFCSLSSFLTQKPTNVTMTCLTDCVIESISHEDFIKALDTSLIVNKLGRKIAEHSYLIRIKKEKDMLTKTATERYQELFTTRPELIQQIPLSKIAKYLGIDPRSLSRVRKTMFK